MRNRSVASLSTVWGDGRLEQNMFMMAMKLPQPETSFAASSEIEFFVWANEFRMSLILVRYGCRGCVHQSQARKKKRTHVSR